MINPEQCSRFWAKVDKNGPNGCWTWIGAKTGLGYGEFWPGGDYGRKMVYTHRLAYELMVGPIPDGLYLDHLCRNTSCCNPEHLEPVTHGENLRRGNAGKNMREKTHCPHGHLYDLTNTRIYEGRRFCRACNKAKNDLQRAERRKHV